VIREDLEGNFSVQARVFREIDFAHAAFTDLLKNLAVANGFADIFSLPRLSKDLL